MKNSAKLFGIIALVAVIGFSMIACGDGDGGGGDDNGGQQGGAGDDSEKILVITGIPANVDVYRLRNGEQAASAGVYPVGTTHVQTMSGTGLVADYYDKDNKSFSSGSGPYTFTFPLNNPNSTRWDGETAKEETPWTGNGTYDIYFNLDGDGGHTYRIPNVKFLSATTTVSFSKAEDLIKKSGGYSYVESDDGIIITGYTGSGGEETIPSQVNGKTVIRINGIVFQDNADLTSITIPKSVKTIEGWGNFQNCANLTTVTFEAGSALETIGGGAFIDCNSLTSITIPKSVKTIEGWGAFSNCTDLATVTFEAESALETIGSGAFFNCNLTSIIIPDSVTLIEGGAFSGNSLSEVTIGANVTFDEWLPFDYSFEYTYIYYEKAAGTYQLKYDDDGDSYWDKE